MGPSWLIVMQQLAMILLIVVFNLPTILMYLIYIKQKMALYPKNTIGAVKSFGSKFRPSAPSVRSVVSVP